MTHSDRTRVIVQEIGSTERTTQIWQVVEQGPRCFEPVTQAWSKTWELEDVLIFMVSFFMTLGFR